jgi:hypothetical protein
MISALPQAVDTMMAAGELREEDLDKLGIPADKHQHNQRVRDELTVNRRRGVILTKARFVERCAGQRAAKERLEEARCATAFRKAEKTASKGKRTQALRAGPPPDHPDDVTCIVCRASFYAYQEAGLVENGKRHQWKQCEWCDSWFCPEHKIFLGGKLGHEAMCEQAQLAGVEQQRVGVEEQQLKGVEEQQSVRTSGRSRKPPQKMLEASNAMTSDSESDEHIARVVPAAGLQIRVAKFHPLSGHRDAPLAVAARKAAAAAAAACQLELEDAV